MFQVKNYNPRNPASLGRMQADIITRAAEIEVGHGSAPTEAEARELERGAAMLTDANTARKFAARLDGTKAADPGFDAQAWTDAGGHLDTRTRGGLLSHPLAINAKGWREHLATLSSGRPARLDLGNATHLRDFTTGVTTKASTFDGATSGSGAGSGAILPHMFPPIPQALEQTRVGDLFDHVPLDAPTWTYVRHDTTTGGPGVTAELAVKPVVSFGTTVVTGHVTKLAGTYTHSYELARDFEVFAAEMVPSELTRTLINAESAFLLNGAPEDEPGGAAPTADGLLGAAGLTAQVSTSDTAPGSPGLRAINKAVTTLRSGAAFAVADTIVLSPNTFGELRGAVDSMGRFLLTDAAGDGAVPKIWNLRVCTTTQIADGTALICDSTQYARVMVRDAIQLMSFMDGAQLASTNSVMHVVEERVGLSIPRPAAGLVLTGITN